MSVSGAGVSNYVYTTSAQALGVSALYGVGGSGVVAGDLSSQIAAMFANGEQGAWYDPSDFSSMYQDSAGTTPVTAITQSVGLLLDKRLGLVRGAEVWNDANTSFVANSSKVSPGVYRLFSSTGAETADILCTGIFANTWYEVTFTIDSVAAAGGGVRVGAASAGAVVAATVGAKRCISLCDANANAFKRVSGITDLQISNVSFKALPGNHATQATAGSRPTLQVDGNGKYYLSFDGTDDSLATASIDFSATDKMTVWAGVYKASDVARGMVYELGNSSAGAFSLNAPNNAAANNYVWTSGGTNVAAGQASAPAIAPIMNVVTGIGDIAGDIATIRVNGVVIATGAADQGTGNYSNLALNIGRRNGASLPFSGRIYGLIVRGAASTAAQISSGEQYEAGKSGVVLA